MHSFKLLLALIVAICTSCDAVPRGSLSDESNFKSYPVAQYEAANHRLLRAKDGKVRADEERLSSNPDSMLTRIKSFVNPGPFHELVRTATAIAERLKETVHSTLDHWLTIQRFNHLLGHCDHDSMDSAIVRGFHPSEFRVWLDLKSPLATEVVDSLDEWPKSTQLQSLLKFIKHYHSLLLPPPNHWAKVRASINPSHASSKPLFHDVYGIKEALEEMDHIIDQDLSVATMLEQKVSPLLYKVALEARELKTGKRIDRSKLNRFIKGYMAQYPSLDKFESMVNGYAPPGKFRKIPTFKGLDDDVINPPKYLNP
uniref:Secreted RxLR effector protein 14 n=1 Tax=Plasmopara viticola TaxID=143451 RepID=RLR14_PLAVT|nr:RecName: Full=Secreted RxLR effector protein 14; Flags: Precursor [Plasmopara viticola]